jgi:hypothetical protein
LRYSSSGSWLPTISSRLGYWIDAVQRIDGPAGGSWVVRKADGVCVRLGTGRKLVEDDEVLLKALWQEWWRHQDASPCGCTGTDSA